MENEFKISLVKNYTQAYNNFDVEKMTADLHDEIIFKNISNGEVNLKTNGIEAFKNQAEQAVIFFSEREQTIENIECKDDVCEVEINYRGKLAVELPNGLKKGDEINLKGKSIFRFADRKIIEIEDIS